MSVADIFISNIFRVTKNMWFHRVYIKILFNVFDGLGKDIDFFSLIAHVITNDTMIVDPDMYWKSENIQHYCGLN